jgi:hypothetical protein
LWWLSCALELAIAGNRDLLGAESRIGGCIVPPLVDEPAQGFPILGTYVLGILSGWGLVGLIKRLFSDGPRAPELMSKTSTCIQYKIS